MKKLLTALAATAGIAVAVPAPAQAQVGWSITIGSGDNVRDYNRDGRIDWRDRDRHSRDYNRNFRYDQHWNTGNSCYRIQGLRTNRGALIVDRTYRIRPTNHFCVNDRSRYGYRSQGREMIIHDVNNNGIYDYGDGVGYTNQGRWNDRNNTQTVVLRYNGGRRW